MQLLQLSLRNYRCFESFDVRCNAPRIIIQGANGSGKSSIIEALDYCCYLNSFRTSRTQDLARIEGNEGFFIKVVFKNDEDEETSLHVGFDDGVKRVKVNENVVSTYKQVISQYRVITLAEHDLALIAGGPEERRSFLNHYCLLQDPDFTLHMRQYKQVLEQRNQLLFHGDRGPQLAVWTQQLWKLSAEIDVRRVTLLSDLEQRVNELLMECSQGSYQATLTYVRKDRNITQTFDAFWSEYEAGRLSAELKMKRTLFGAHLDDVAILLNNKPARQFASRGQQKLLLVLLKIAQMQELQVRYPSSNLLLLLDDFLTDFDPIMLKRVLSVIEKLSCQVIITCPLENIITLPEPCQVISL